MKPGTILLALLVWLPGQAALAQSDPTPEVAACLNSSALSIMRNAGAHVDEGKTSYPSGPTIRGEPYVAVTEGLYAIPPDQLRYNAKLENGEPLFVRFGLALGAPGSLYMLASTDIEDGGCGFVRFNLRDRWMETYLNDGFQELIDLATVTYKDGVFGFKMLTFGGYRSPDADPAHVYDLDHMAFKCPDRRGLRHALDMTEDGEVLWGGDFDGDGGEPAWQESMPMDRVLPLQRYFCSNGAGSNIATAFPDVATALAAWRARYQR